MVFITLTHTRLVDRSMQEQKCNLNNATKVLIYDQHLCLTFKLLSIQCFVESFYKPDVTQTLEPAYSGIFEEFMLFFEGLKE